MSLSDCLSKFGKTFTPEERAALFAERKKHIGDGLDQRSAEMAAVQGAHAEAQSEHALVLKAIAEAMPKPVEVDDTPVFDTKQAAMLEAVRQTKEFRQKFKAVQHPTETGKWIVELKPQSEKQQEAAERTSKRAKARLKPSESTDSLTTYIAKLGGLHPQEAPDITGEHRPERAPNHPLLYVLRKNGGMFLDDMIPYLVDGGYFVEGVDIQDVRDAIRAELDGKNHYSVHADEMLADQRAEQDKLGEETAVQFAESAGVEDIEMASTPEELAAHRDFVPAIESEMTAARRALAELSVEATALDEAAAERLAMQFEGDDAAYARALQEIIYANEQNVAGRDDRVGETVEPLALTGETEAERTAREAGERARTDREQREAAERDARSRADAELGDFGLTGSDRVADVAAAAGQTSLLQENVDALPADKSFAKFKKLTQAVQHVVSKGDPFYSALGRRISQSIEGATFTVVESGVNVPGGVPTALRGARGVQMIDKSKGLNGVWVKGDSFGVEQGINDQTVMHEALHQATARKIELGNMRASAGSELQKSVSELYALANHVITAYKQTSNPSPELSSVAAAAFNDPRELVSHGLTTPVVQEFLKAIPGLQKKSAWSEFVDSIRKILGLAVEHTSALADLIEITDRIIASEIPASAKEVESQLVSHGLAQQLPSSAAPPTTPAQRTAFIASASRRLRNQHPQPAAWVGDLGSFVDHAIKPRTIAAFNRDAVPAYLTLIEEQKFRDNKFAEYTRAAEPYFLGTKVDRAVVDKILEHDRLTGAFGLAGQNMTVHFTSQDAALSRPGERVTVTPEQKTMYWAARDMLNKTFEDFKARLLESFNLPAGSTVAGIRALTAQPLGIQAPTAVQKGAYTRRVKELTAAADALEAVEGSYKRGYVPFSRFGNVGIAVKNTQGQTVEYVTLDLGPIDRLRAKRGFDRIPEVRVALDRLRAKYRGTANVVGAPFKIPTGKLAKEVSLADVDVLAEIGKIEDAQWDDIRKQLATGQAAQGFRAHLFRSRAIPGYSTDFERVLANYINQAATFQARRKYAKQWNEAINNIDAGRQPTLRKYFKDHAVYAHDPKEEFSALRATTFAYYLTSIASWMVNLTQTVTVTAPYAMQFASPMAVSAAMSRGWLEAGRMLSWDATKKMQFYDPQKAPADVRAAVMKAFDEGEFVNVVTRDYMGLAKNTHPVLKKLTPAAQRVVELLGAGFTVAEMQNRLSTYIAMYRLARDNPRVKVDFARIMPKNAIAEQLIANWSPAGFADFVNDETNFKMGKINRARLERGAGAAITQFWGYVWNYVERLATMTALQGAEGRASAVLMLTIMWFLAGIWGLPGLDRLRQLIELLHRKIFKSDLDLDLEMRKLVVEATGTMELAYMMSGGVTRAVGGPDLSSRIGMGQLFNAPVFLDLVGRLPDAMEQFEVNNTKLAIAELLPRQAGDILIAQAWGEQGVRTQATDAPVIPRSGVTASMQVQKALGFNPAQVAEIRARERAEKRIERSADEAKHDFYRRLAKAQFAEQEADDAGDKKDAKRWEVEIEKIWTEVDKWNDTHPDNEFIRLDPKTQKENLAREREGADRQKGKRRAARGTIADIQDYYRTDAR